MNPTFTRISLFAIKAQRYLSIAMMAFAMFAMLIMRSPDGDGGIGR